MNNPIVSNKHQSLLAQNLLTEALMANKYLVVEDCHDGRQGLLAVRLAAPGQPFDAFVVELFQQTEAGAFPEPPMTPFEVARTLDLPCFQAFVDKEGTHVAVTPDLHARMSYDKAELVVYEMYY